MADSGTADKLKLEDFLPYKLSILSNKVSATIAQTYKHKFALSITEWRIMAVLGEYSDISADEVSAKTQIEKSILSRSISKLLTRQLLQRDFAEDDRRRSVLRLSELGRNVYAEVLPISHQYQEALLTCFTHSEKELFSRLIERLQKQIDLINLG